MTRRPPSPSAAARRGSPRFDAELAGVLGRALRRHARARPGAMFGYPAFYTGGKLFACVFEDAVALKLPADVVADALGTPGFAPFERRGRRMREWVMVGRERARELGRRPALVLRSLEFVGALSRRPRAASRTT